MKKIALLITLVPLLTFSQTIKGKINIENNIGYAFLYKAEPNTANYVTKAALDSLGQFSITLDSTSTAGIYKIVYAIPPEDNNFDIIYDGKENITFNFSDAEGLVFSESSENRLWHSYQKSIDMVNQTMGNYYANNNKDEKTFSNIVKTLNEAQLGFEDASRDKLVSAFIASSKPYIPTAYEDVSTYAKNSRTAYLKRIDFNDYLLQSSSFLKDHVESYVFDMIKTPDEETYKSLIDDLGSVMQVKDAVVEEALWFNLWKRFVTSEKASIANYITENYLLKLARKNNNTNLENTIVGYSNTTIGKTAPDFDINTNETSTTLHQLKGSKYYLLVFWSSGCGHCLSELPKVKDLVAKKTNLQVVAYGLEEAKENWQNEIKNYPNFTHTIGLGKWEHPIVKTYGVSATPMYFLLSESKIIMAKPFSFEDLEVVLKDL